MDVALASRQGGVGRRLRVDVGDIARDSGFDPYREYFNRLKECLGERTELTLVLGVEVGQQLCARGLINWSVADRHRDRLEQLFGVAHQRDPSQLELARGHRSSRARFRLVDGDVQLVWI